MEQKGSRFIGKSSATNGNKVHKHHKKYVVSKVQFYYSARAFKEMKMTTDILLQRSRGNDDCKRCTKLLAGIQPSGSRLPCIKMDVSRIERRANARGGKLPARFYRVSSIMENTASRATTKDVLRARFAPRWRQRISEPS